MPHPRTRELLTHTRCALLAVDLQRLYFTGGSIATVGGEAALPQLERLLAEWRNRNLGPIVFTQEVHRKERVDFGRELDGNEPLHCIENWEETELHPPLAPRDGEFVIAKRRYSSFFGTDLEILLRGLSIESLFIVGAVTNVCVHYTAVDAHQWDYRISVIRDCCIGSDPLAHSAALQAIEYLQRDSVITLDEWLDSLGG